MAGYGLFGGVRGSGLMLGSGSNKACREGDTLVLCNIGVCGGVNSSFDSLPFLAAFWLPSDFDLGLPLVAGSTMNGAWADLPKPDLVKRKDASILLELLEFRLTACLSLLASISDKRFDMIKTEASFEAGVMVNLVLSIIDSAFGGIF